MRSVSAIRPRVCALLALLCCVLPASAQEKKLTVYASQTSYVLSVAERDGKEYVAITDLLQPLGALAVNVDGKKMKLTLTPPGGKPVGAQFTDGKTGGKVRGRDVELASRFALEGVRGLVPVHSLGAVLGRFFDIPIEFHEPGRRLFLGGPLVHYVAEPKKSPTRVVLSFTAPVNPSVATEPGGLRMVFAREPVVAPGAFSQTFDDHPLTGMTFSETNGTAELAIAASVPLLANISDGGRTITVALAPPPPAPPARADVQNVAPALPQPAAAVQPRPKFLVVIDPGHGGTDSGAALGDVAEKDFNLSLARRLRAELEAHDVSAVLLREGDIAMSLQQRALTANGSHAAVYIAIHATGTGVGVKAYTSDIAPAASRTGFVLVDRVQAAYVERATLIAGGIVAELQKRQVRAAALPAPVRPLNNVAAAAVALEIAPPENDAQGFASPVYQQSICTAVGAALAQARARLEGER